MGKMKHKLKSESESPPELKSFAGDLDFFPGAQPNPAFRHSRIWKHFVAKVEAGNAEGAGAVF